MDNPIIKVTGDKLYIEVDLKKEEGRSASGKTIVIASTHGNQQFKLPDGRPAWIGLNVYKK